VSGLRGRGLLESIETFEKWELKIKRAPGLYFRLRRFGLQVDDWDSPQQSWPYNTCGEVTKCIITNDDSEQQIRLPANTACEVTKYTDAGSTKYA
jgi:hypothetical protein